MDKAIFLALAGVTLYAAGMQFVWGHVLTGVLMGTAALYMWCSVLNNSEKTTQGTKRLIALVWTMAIIFGLALL